MKLFLLIVFVTLSLYICLGLAARPQVKNATNHKAKAKKAQVKLAKKSQVKLAKKEAKVEKLSEADDAAETNPDPELAAVAKRGAAKRGAAQGNCPEGEVMTKTAGCQNRDMMIDRLLLHTWIDEDLSDVRRVGIPTENCKAEEILTALGCVPKEKEKTGSVAVRTEHVKHGNVMGNRVMPDGIVQEGEWEDGAVGDDELPGVATRGGNAVQGIEPSETEKEEDFLKERLAGMLSYIGKRILGHNVPRKHIYLPGRRIPEGRTCRPYEKLVKGRCILKKGKTGFYKHHDHVYHEERRHRHPKLGEEPENVDGSQESKQYNEDDLIVNTGRRR